MNYAETILTSRHIFTATKRELFAGYIAISEGKILSIGEIPDNRIIGPQTKIIDADEQLICPGFIDVHCFFSGYAMNFVGVDLSKMQTVQEIQSALTDYEETALTDRPILGTA